MEMDKVVAYVRGQSIATAYSKAGGPLINAYGMRFETVTAFYNFALEKMHFDKTDKSHSDIK